MRLFIYQRGSNYKIYQDNQEDLLFVGEWYRKWNQGRQLLLTDLQGNPLLTAKETDYKWWKWKRNRPYRLVLLQEQHTFDLTCVHYRQQHWQMTDGKDIYDYYVHRRHLKSIFKNDIQIAGINKKIFHWYQHDTLYIDLDRDVNPLLLAGLALTFDMGEDKREGTVTIDLGTISLSKRREYNQEWSPK
ncbi:hypothetical protein [Chitinophaga nivalis]|uniref:Uncharacterized protein n=1 Tax=Chitinophaga nivalis TaxID=2991709 RepID=A0ABT3IPB8_9BACT|nr:hypothetical protein [Chitinophaga nivalis]MCW3464492.1 hypothetical protein [Chitinophaga nivalis]MCW3485817.1 hypothetical protein [Chitinophaga nivalis]